jgi:hypothetical protein
VDGLEKWFLAQWPSPESAAAEWEAYLHGHYVCLKTVSPAWMQRKDDLIVRIREALHQRAYESPGGLEDLHALVDELDGVLAGFAAYDRLRFGGPISRDVYVDEVRAKYPRGGQGPADPPGPANPAGLAGPKTESGPASPRGRRPRGHSPAPRVSARMTS